MTLPLTHAARKAPIAALIALAALGLGLMLFAPLRTSAAGSSVKIPQVTLTGGEEVPAVTVNAIGYFSATLTDAALEFDLSADGDQFTQAHIHMAAKGTNGPVVAFLYGPADPQRAIHPTGTIDVADLVGPLAGNWKGFTDALAKGELYVNVHSVANPGGAVRAQLPPVPPAPPATGSGIASNGFGSGYQVAGAAILTVAVAALVFVASRRRA
jgi:hypothetical protein